MSLPTQGQLLLKAQKQFQELTAYLQSQSQQHARIDQVERGLFSLLLTLGRTLLEAFMAGAGLGDAGPQVTSGDRTLQRSEELHRRWYRSIFGKLAIWRWVYAPGLKKKIESVPTDAQLGLPRGEYSYVLEDWLERLCVKEAFAEGVEGLASLLGIEASVRTAEEQNRQMAEFAEGFRLQQPAPPASEEETILVATADGTSVPICAADRSPRPARDKLPELGRPPGTTRRAYIGAVYSIAAFVRQPEEVWDELFRNEATPRRPRPQGKRLWTEMAETENGKNLGSERVFIELAIDVSHRDPDRQKTLVCLMDGERKLWDLQQSWLGRSVQILDFFHVLERVREVSKLMEPDFLPRREVWVSDQVRDLLEGRVESVLRRWRRLRNPAKKWLKSQRETLESAIGYFSNNCQRMQYDVYLAKGYPIGSGVAEGACRHLVKDRMDGTGMHWRLAGARAMLKTRALSLNGEWDEFVEYRIQQEQQTLYQTAA